MALNIGELVAIIDADEKPFERSVDRAERRIERMSRTTNRRMSSVSGAFRAAARALGALGGTARTVGVITAAVGALALVTNSVATALSALPALISTLAAASGALLLLPAAATAAGVALGTLHLALSGVSNAISAGLTGDTEAYTEALQGLAPAARSTVEAVVALGPAFSELKTSVQSAVFAGMAERVRILGEQYLPLLTTQLTHVGRAFNAAFKQTADLFTTQQSLSDVNTILGNISTSAHNLSGALAPIVQIFRDITAVGSSFLPGLTGGFTNAAKAAAEFISEARDSGQLQEWMQGGLDALKRIGSFLGDLGGIAKGVFSALGDGGSLGFFGDLASTLNEVVNSAGGQAGLSSVFGALGDIANALKPVLGAVGGALVPLGKIFGDLVSALGPGVTAVLKGLTTGLTALTPVAGPVGDAISAIFSALAPLLPVLGQLIAELLPPLTLLFSELASEAEPLIQQLAAELAPILPQLGAAFMELVRALVPLIPHFAAWSKELLPLLVPLLNLLVIAIAGVAGAINLLTPVIAGVIGSIVGWIKWLKTLWSAITSLDFGKIADGISAFATRAAGLIAGFLTRVGALLGQLPHMFRDTVSTATRWAYTALTTGIGWLVSAAASLPGRLIGAAGSIVWRIQRLIWDAGLTANRALWDGIGWLTNAAGQIPGRILGALGDTGKMLYDAGISIVQGLIDGLGDKLRDLRRAASNVASTIKDHLPFSPAKRGPFAGRGNPFYSGLSIGRLLAEGMNQRGGLVAASASRLAGAASMSLAPQFAAAGMSAGSPAPQPPASSAAPSGGTFRLVDGADRTLALLVRQGERDLGRR